MIARGFKSVMWVATVGGAALACYMVSLQVATERNELAKVEAQIIAAKRDIRALQTELGTRGRLSQLEHWNAEVLALSAPASAQFLDNEVTLARFEQRQPTVEDRAAEVRLASAETAPVVRVPEAKPAPVVHAVAPAATPAQPVVHRASFTAPLPKAPAEPAVSKPAKPSGAASTPPATAKAVKPKPEATRTAAVAPTVKPEKPAQAKAKPATPRSRGLDSSLASEIGAAARAEKKSGGKGGN